MTLRRETRSFLVNKKYLLTSAVLAFAVSALAGTDAYAAMLDQNVSDDEIIHNEQQVNDSRTVTTDSQGNTTSDTSQVSDNCYYDNLQNLFVYEYGSSGSSTVTCTVADGMFTNDSVSVTCTDDVTVRVFRNGSEVTDADLTSISDPGSYVLLINSSSSGDASDESIAFRIISEYTNADTFSVPDGFTLQSVSCDGETIQTSGNQVDLSTEGEYQLNYICDGNEMNYSVHFIVDHTAPVLALAAVKDGVARSAVDISDLEQGATIYAELNGDQISVGKKITQVGTYKLTIYDVAGNVTIYQFTILMYFTTTTFAVFLVILAIIIALIVYVITVKKRLKVR